MSAAPCCACPPGFGVCGSRVSSRVSACVNKRVRTGEHAIKFVGSFESRFIPGSQEWLPTGGIPQPKGQVRLVQASHVAGAVGEAANVRIMTTVANMPEAAAQNVLGEPLERSLHLPTPHSPPALCNGARFACFPSRERRAPRQEKKRLKPWRAFTGCSGT